MSKKTEIAKKMKVKSDKPLRFSHSTDVSDAKNPKKTIRAIGANGTPFTDEQWKKWYSTKSNKPYRD